MKVLVYVVTIYVNTALTAISLARYKWPVKVKNVHFHPAEIKDEVQHSDYDCAPRPVSGGGNHHQHI